MGSPDAEILKQDGEPLSHHLIGYMLPALPPPPPGAHLWWSVVQAN